MNGPAEKPQQHAEKTLPPGASPLSGVPPPVHTRWRKGQSGNPGGRPKGTGVTGELRRLLEQVHNGKPLKEVLAERWLKDALSGKPSHLQMLLERTEGKVTDTHEVRVAPWREAIKNISDEDFIALAVKHGRLDLLPNHLRQRAEQHHGR